MADTSSRSLSLQGLAQQGYYEHTDEELARLAWGLRFTPAVCMAAALVGLATGIAEIHFALAALGLLTFFTPAHHPVDLLYNHVVRHLLGAPPIPPNPLPRRIACAAGGAMNLGIGLAFVAELPPLAYTFGVVLVALQLIVITSHFCVASWILESVLALTGRRQSFISGDDARRVLDAGGLLVDVRSPAEYGRGHLPGAINRPVDEILAGRDELPEGRSLILYCQAGLRCRQAASTLRRKAGMGPVHQLGRMDRW